MQIYHSLKWSICQRQINRQQFFKVMPEYLYGFSEVIPRCWNFIWLYLWLCLKVNFILFKTNSLYFHDLFTTTFAFISWILLAPLKSKDKQRQVCKRNESSVGRRGEDETFALVLLETAQSVIRGRWFGAYNCTIFLSRCFHRPIYF